MKPNLAVTNDIMVFAFRYALGSSSDVPELVMDTIKENIRSIDDVDLRQYIREIYECRNSGKLPEETNWIDFVDFLQEELRSRE